MRPRLKNLSITTRNALLQLLSGPQAFAFLPAAILSTFWLGGEVLLIILSITLPLVLLCFRSLAHTNRGRLFDGMLPDMPPEPDVLTSELDTFLQHAKSKMLKTACILVAIDDGDEVSNRYGHATAQYVVDCTFERLRGVVRDHDSVFLLNDGCIAIAIAPVRHFDLDVGLQLAARLQSTAEEPVKLDATTIYVSASVGFCVSSQLQESTGQSLANCATLALNDAQRHAPSAIRSYSPAMRDLESAAIIHNDGVAEALESGQILPWYQPQISTDTGLITGFEALARWENPERGIIAPAEFLPLLENGALMERLGEQMLYQSLKALTSWDALGLDVPCVGVNFSPDELRNPRLLEKVEWELDRFDLTPDRLVVEVLETVMATSLDDTVARNINGMSALGCRIDLDDFGTGHASISSIRRFAIHRLKIDRSFIMKVDQDLEQQRMVSAILVMAERLELDTLAEGVETAGEHAMLAQLGCGHVQGFGIARPMPFDKTADWIKAHSTKPDVPPIIGRKIG